MLKGKHMDKKIDSFFNSFAEADEKLEVSLSSDKSTEIKDVYSTGSYLLDDMLGCGGLPAGRLVQLYGPAGSGKTLVSLFTIKSAQQKDPESKQVFIDAEHTFDHSWASKLGVDPDRVILIRGDLATNGRRMFEMLLGSPKEDKTHVYVGKSKEGLLDKIRTKEININLIVLDSLGAIIPPGEDISDVGKMNISLMARFLSTTLKKLSLEVAKAQIPFIVINHKRDSMNMYGPSHTYSGGNSYTHFLSASIYFERVQRKDAQILDKNEQMIGSIIRASVEKSKFGPPRKCEFKVN